MSSTLTLLVFVSGFLASYAQPPALEIQQHFELFKAVPVSQENNWRWRSEASANKTLRIEDETGSSRLELTLCVEPYNATQNVTLYIDDIRYSNDGLSDVVKLIFNGINFANFTTFQKFRSGHEWNVFRNSGTLGPALNLRQGRYTLLITVVTDEYGVEFDRIRINAENQNPEVYMFCGSTFYFVPL